MNSNAKYTARSLCAEPGEKGFFYFFLNTQKAKLHSVQKHYGEALTSLSGVLMEFQTEKGSYSDGM